MSSKAPKHDLRINQAISDVLSSHPLSTADQQSTGQEEAETFDWRDVHPEEARFVYQLITETQRAYESVADGLTFALRQRYRASPGIAYEFAQFARTRRDAVLIRAWLRSRNPAPPAPIPVVNVTLVEEPGTAEDEPGYNLAFEIEPQPSRATEELAISTSQAATLR